MTMIRSPAFTFSSPREAQARTSSQASGAPSGPWRGAPFRSFKVERMMPIGRSASRARAAVATRALALMVIPSRDGPASGPPAGDTEPALLPLLEHFDVREPSGCEPGAMLVGAQVGGAERQHRHLLAEVVPATLVALDDDREHAAGLDDAQDLADVPGQVRPVVVGLHRG